MRSIVSRNFSRQLHGASSAFRKTAVAQFGNSSQAASSKTDPRSERFKNPKTWVPLVDGQYKVRPAQKIPAHIKRPYYANQPNGEPEQLSSDLFAEAKSPEQIAGMRRAARVAAESLHTAIAKCQEGVLIDEIDALSHNTTVSLGGYPAGVNFHGFPKAICASANNVVVHGIPDTRPLQNGDIVNFDVAVYFEGYYGDCSAMVQIGDVDEMGQKLCRVTKESVYKTIETIKPGDPLELIAQTVTKYAADHGFRVVPDFCGHFIGREMHMRPNVQHRWPCTKTDVILKPGMIFTIEPILAEGSSDIFVWGDGWTYATVDGGRSAQHEHTVLITENGCEILTEWPQ